MTTYLDNEHHHIQFNPHYSIYNFYYTLPVQRVSSLILNLFSLLHTFCKHNSSVTCSSRLLGPLDTPLEPQIKETQGQIQNIRYGKHLTWNQPDYASQFDIPSLQRISRLLHSLSLILKSPILIPPICSNTLYALTLESGTRFLLWRLAIYPVVENVMRNNLHRISIGVSDEG